MPGFDEIKQPQGSKRKAIVDKQSTDNFIQHIYVQIDGAILAITGAKTRDVSVKLIINSLKNHIQTLEKNYSLAMQDSEEDVSVEQFIGFVGESLSAVKIVTSQLQASMPTEDSALPRSKCEALCAFLTFLLTKALRLLTCDGTPVYPEGLYQGLFSVRKQNAGNTGLTALECNLEREMLDATDVMRLDTGDDLFKHAPSWNV